MGKIILYGIDMSPPVRACILTLKALELPFEFKEVNILGNEQFDKEYLKKNPQHTIPTLEDDGQFIWDSHAIVAYLVSKYGKNDTLYPKDPLKRAVVDQRLHFDSGVAFPALRAMSILLFWKKEKNIPQQRIDAFFEAYDFVEAFFKDHPYIAGDQLTVADFCLIATLTSTVAYAEIDAAKYPKITAWKKRLEQLPYYAEANGKGAQKLVAFIKSVNFVIVP